MTLDKIRLGRELKEHIGGIAPTSLRWESTVKEWASKQGIANQGELCDIIAVSKMSNKERHRLIYKGVN